MSEKFIITGCLSDPADPVVPEPTKKKSKMTTYVAIGAAIAIAIGLLVYFT